MQSLNSRICSSILLSSFQLTAPISAKPNKAASRVDKAVPTIVRFKLLRSAVGSLSLFLASFQYFSSFCHLDFKSEEDCQEFSRHSPLFASFSTFA